jgi:hypothetical protein
MIGKITERALHDWGGPFPATVELAGGYKGPAKVHGIRGVGEGEQQEVEILMETPVGCLGLICCMPYAHEGREEASHPQIYGLRPALACWVHEKDIPVFGSLAWPDLEKE